jgi:hypothetical protein
LNDHWPPARPYGIEFVEDDRGTVLRGGWNIPLLEVRGSHDGRRIFIVDQRFGYDIPDEVAELVACIFSEGVAIGLGLTHFPGPSEVYPLDGSPSQRADEFRQELLRLHPVLRPRPHIGISAVREAPLGPHPVEPAPPAGTREKE